MNKMLKQLNVRLKKDTELFSKTKIAASSDVAFLMGKKFDEMKDDNIAVLNLNTANQIISINFCTVETMEKDMNMVIASAITSNAANVITIANEDSPRKENVIRLFNSTMKVLGITMFDHIYKDKDADKEYESYRQTQRIDFSTEISPKINYSSKIPEMGYDDNLHRLELVEEKIIDVDDISKEAVITKIVEEMAYFDRENMAVISLDQNDNVINYHYFSQGDLNSAVIHPREVLKVPLLSEAESIILMHNHPSGQVNPSEEDMMTTGRIMATCKIMGLKYDDHIIVGGINRKIYSFKENRTLNSIEELNTKLYENYQIREDNKNNKIVKKAKQSVRR